MLPHGVSSLVAGYHYQILPFDLGRLDPPPRPRGGTQPLRNELGEVVVSEHGRPIKDFPGLPTVIRPDVSAFQVECWMRNYPDLRYIDIEARFPKGTPKWPRNEKNALNNRRRREVRDRYNIRDWSARYEKRPSRVLLELVDKLSDEQISLNTSWVVTPTHIHPPGLPAYTIPRNAYLDDGNSPHAPSLTIQNAKALLSRLKAKAITKGKANWRELDEDDLPREWFVRTGKRKLRTDDDDDDETRDSIVVQPTADESVTKDSSRATRAAEQEENHDFDSEEDTEPHLTNKKRRALARRPLQEHTFQAAETVTAPSAPSMSSEPVERGTVMVSFSALHSHFILLLILLQMSRNSPTTCVPPMSHYSQPNAYQILATTFTSIYQLPGETSDYHAQNHEPFYPQVGQAARPYHPSFAQPQINQGYNFVDPRLVEDHPQGMNSFRHGLDMQTNSRPFQNTFVGNAMQPAVTRNSFHLHGSWESAQLPRPQPAYAPTFPRSLHNVETAQRGTHSSVDRPRASGYYPDNNNDDWLEEATSRSQTEYEENRLVPSSSMPSRASYLVTTPSMPNLTGDFRPDGLKEDYDHRASIPTLMSEAASQQEAHEMFSSFRY